MAIKFEFTGKIGSGGFFDEDSTKKVTFELDDNDLTTQELLDEFQNFLRGVGYFFKDTQTFELVDHSETKEEVAVEVKPVTPAPKVVSDEALAREVARIRDSTLGLSEEAIHLAAYHNLNRGAE
jgi:hypothetical protein